MSYYYQYSVLNDITLQRISITTLHNELTNNLVLSNATFSGINIKGDALYISFSEEITNDEKIALDLIVANHDFSFTGTYLSQITVFPKFQTVTTTEYMLIARFIYPGTLNTSEIKSIDILSYMDQGAASYDILIVNRTNDSIIATGNFTNTTYSKMTISNIQNIPVDSSIVEVLCKVNKIDSSIKKTYIDQLIFWI